MAPVSSAPDPFLEGFYFATNFHGMIVYEERLERSKHLQRPETNVVHLGNFTSCIHEGLAIAKILLAGITANLKLDVLVEE